MIGSDEWNIAVVNTLQDKIYSGTFGLENLIEDTVKHSPEKIAKKVEEIMARNVVACTPEDGVDNIWRLMQAKSFAGLPVVKDDKLIGIVTQKDLIESGGLLLTFESKKGHFRASSKIASIMKTHVIAVQPEIKAIRVAKVMISKNIGRVSVIDKNGKLIGIVDREDVVKLIIK